MIVDDDASLRGMLTLTLEQAAYTVFSASDRLSALSLLDQSNTDIILLDLGMPPNEHTAEEGLAVLDWVQNNKPDCYVVILSGQDADDAAFQAIQHGAFDFLEKPVTSSTLLAAMKRAQLFQHQRKRLLAENQLHNIELSVQEGQGVKAVRNQAEEKLLQRVLTNTQFNVHETARRLGLKRENVYYLIKKYHIERPADNV